jgi:hypothetical protein
MTDVDSNDYHNKNARDIPLGFANLVSKQIALPN